MTGPEGALVHYRHDQCLGLAVERLQVAEGLVVLRRRLRFADRLRRWRSGLTGRGVRCGHAAAGEAALAGEDDEPNPGGWYGPAAGPRPACPWNGPWALTAKLNTPTTTTSMMANASAAPTAGS